MTPSSPPDSAELADSAATFRTAYVHVPFCARICPYCDFAVVEGRGEVVDRYVDAVLREMDDEPAWGPLDAVFVGGGTPSSVPPPALARVLGGLRDRFGLTDDAEVTLEANPEDWAHDRAAALAEAGFTRVSFGAQSFDQVVLAALGRRHGPDDIVRAVHQSRVEGFGSISVDLIFGTPGESLSSWEATVDAAIALGVDHVSTYALTVEPPTALGRAVRQGAAAPDPDDQADKWELAADKLAAAGLVRYEVSNHARPGHPCRYNLGVWAQGEYLAYGLGAHGFRRGLRKRNVRRLDTYLERVESGVGAIQAVDRIDGWPAELERLMLGLRRNAGVQAGPGGSALLASDQGRRLVEAGVLSEKGGRLIVTRPLLTDEVVRAVLALEDRATV
jgi:putative oxygen-independent coproporphyrinogen III oxidase